MYKKHIVLEIGNYYYNQKKEEVHSALDAG
jgi:hypothetical protein